MKVAWIKGPPPGRGTFWIATMFEGTRLVDLVGISPAYIHRHDPTAPLQVKWMTGIANRFEEIKSSITHHARVETPEAP